MSHSWIIGRVAWRNIWRSPLRSGLLISSVALGVWAGIFIMAFANGLNQQRTEAALLSGMGHLQLHSEGYRKDPKLGTVLHQQQELEAQKALEELGWPKFSTRICAEAMASSSKSASGIQLYGVDAEQEASINRVAHQLIEGEWLNGKASNTLVMGKKLADKLGLALGSRLVITTQKADEELISLAFRVGGIYRTGNRAIDEMQVFTDRSMLTEQLDLISGDWHEMSVLSNDPKRLEEPIAFLQSALGSGIEVVPWTVLSPELGYADEMMANSLLIFMSIILFALAFGIINNMLMAVLERRRELGMLMAVGMNKRRVFSMVMLETLMVTLIGGPLGMLLGYGTIQILMEYGLDLSVYSAGLEEYGIDTVIYPLLQAHWYAQLALMVGLTAVLSGLIPALRALRMNPIETMRSL